MKRYAETAARLFCVICIGILVWFIFEYAFGIVLPFLISFCVGIPIYRISVSASKRINIPQKVCAFVILVGTLCAIGAVIYLSLNRLFKEIDELIAWAGDESEGISGMVKNIFVYVERFSEKIPFINEMEKISGGESFKEGVGNAMKGIFDKLISALTTNLPTWLVNIIKNTPRVMITVLVTVVSCFYVSFDYGRIREAIFGIFSQTVRERIERYLSVGSMAMKKYIRAYLLIMLITFFQVFVGLMILGNRYAFVLACVIAVVDILPIFGAGTVIIPWGLISLGMGERSLGVGLLILYGVITIVRQVSEPRIVGGSLGIHPFITLFSMYAGLKLFGIAGMLLGPGVIMLCKEIKGA